MAKPDLSARQTQASALWMRQFWRYTILDHIVLWGTLILVLLIARQLGLDTAAWTQNGGMGGLSGGGAVGIMFLAQRQAMAAVRRAGLSDESRETITRTATTFEGEDLAFEYPAHPWAKRLWCWAWAPWLPPRGGSGVILRRGR